MRLHQLAAFAWILGTAACGEDASSLDAGPTDSAVDGAPADSGASDSGGADTAVDAGADAGTIETPTISSPSANAAVFGTISVTGTGEAGASLQATVLQGGSAIATESGTVQGDGSFLVTVTYSGPGHNDALTVSVTQSNRGLTSEAATVAVIHTAPSSVFGQVTQLGGPTSGTNVIVNAYATADPSEADSPVASVTVAATDGVTLAASPYTLNVANGTYYLRAFRDSAGGDGLPTLGEAQAPLLGPVVVSGSTSSNNNLNLDAPGNASRYLELNAYVFAEAAVSFAPKVTGQGLCGGTTMRLEGRLNGNAEDLSALWVRTPGGERLELLDDGGCDPTVADNRSSSYDEILGNDAFSYGIPDPDSANAGAYQFFFHQSVDDHIHVEEDAINAIERLSLLRTLTTPDVSDIVRTRMPTLRWEGVVGADQYRLRLFGGGSGFSGGILSTPSITIPISLTSDRCYNIRITAEAVGEPGDVDARSSGDAGWMCVDSDGNSATIIRGDISNSTGQSGPYVIEAWISSGVRVATTLPAGTTSYALGALTTGLSAASRVDVFIDVDGSRDVRTPGNAALRSRAPIVPGVPVVTQRRAEVAFYPQPVPVTPAEGATVGSLTPSFSWQDYATTAGTSAPSDFVMVVSARPLGSEDIPEVAFALPKDVTSFDMNSLPAPTEGVDLAYVARCSDRGGTFGLSATGSRSCAGAVPGLSPTTLQAATRYEWHVAPVECSFPDFANSTERDDFVACIVPEAAAEGFSAIASRELLTP